MRRYADMPMDSAGAWLVDAASTLGVRHIFTLDGDFFVYRLPNGAALEVLPSG